MEQNNLNIYFEWDTAIWRKSMELWENQLCTQRAAKALEIGSRKGSISLMLAKEFDMHVVCSDLNGPEDYARELHCQHQVSHRMKYLAANCMELPFEDNSFDLIVFKSVIGALSTYKNQQTAVSEMYRVLKPGGVLLFAENQKATRLHMYLRQRFVRWSRYWRYLESNDMKRLLSDFSTVKQASNGFFSVFVPEGTIKKIVSAIDGMVCPLLPNSWLYMVYGYAIK